MNVSRPFQEAVGNEVKLIRVMPNTPCLVGETASAMCLGGTATEDDAEVVRTLFSAVGTIFKVKTKGTPAEGFNWVWCLAKEHCLWSKDSL